MKKSLSIGNFVLSDVYQNGKLVGENLPGGINYRYLLMQAYAGVACDYVAYLGNDEKFKQLIQKFSEKDCNLLTDRLASAENLIKFKWFYQNDRLEQLEFINQNKVDLLVDLVNEKLVKKYQHINICALGFNNEKRIFSLIRPAQTISYIFHISNLKQASAEDYLNFLPKLDYVFMNEQEALKLTDSKNISSAFNVFSHWSNNIFVTQGKLGVSYVTKGQVFQNSTIKVPVLNAAGAGDTFAGAVMAAIISGNNIGFAVKYGLLLASISTTGFLTEPLDQWLLIK